MTLEGKSILVTGGTGFIGSRLVEKLLLEQQAHVRILTRSLVRAARLARFPVEIMCGDVTNKEVVRKAVQGCDVVVHCAYDFAGTRASQRQVGVQGVRHVGEAVLQERVARMVYVSTFAVYAPTPEGDLTESAPWPRSPNAYVLIKREAEQLLRDLHRQQQLPVVVIQPTLVYGPLSSHWTLTPVHNLKTGLIPLVDGGVGYCNAVYIDDVVNALILAATQPDVLGETFLISAEQPVTWKRFYNAFEAALGLYATVDVPAEELWQAVRERQRQPGALSQLMRVARHPEVFPQLTALPGVRHLLQLLRGHLSDPQWEWLKSRILQDIGSGQGQPQQPGKSMHLPDATLLALYQSKTCVRISKARQYLGYVPQFDFERGMALTSRFLHWANLA
jgi:nucleoside-diphosphate-sugar epimerase